MQAHYNQSIFCSSASNNYFRILDKHPINMTLKQICAVSNNQLIINLPESFKNKQRVLVIVDDNIDEANEKLMLLQQAATDPLFLADIQEIKEDFNFTDSETT